MAENRGQGEEELRELFQALRREEQRSVPESPASGSLALRRARLARNRRRSQAWALAGLVCAATLIAAVLVHRTDLPTGPSHGLPSPAVPVASIAQWRPPTEFLLETPGREILHATPPFGAGMLPSLEPGPHRRQQSRSPVQTKPSGPR